MIVVIQCAAGKQERAGHLRATDGRDIMFVAKPKSAPPSGGQVYVRPDDVAEPGKSWRTILQEYNQEYNASGDNPLGLLPAWQLYKNRTYELLATHCGKECFFILSAGWGLVRADFLTPNYDITFSTANDVERFKRRSHQEAFEDFMLPSGISEPVVFFGGRNYIPLFCKLTAKTVGRRIVFYAGGSTVAPGCTLRRFGDPFTNWHYQCARAFVTGELQI